MTVMSVDRQLDLINKLKQLFNASRKERQNYHANWYRNYRLVMNIIGTWSSNIRQPSTRISAIYPQLATIVSWMNDQHTSIDISAAADPGTPMQAWYQQIAQDLSDVMESNWEADSYDQEKKLVIWDAMIYGTGFFKSVWDQSLAGGLGNCKPTHVDPFKLYIDPKATSLNDAEYIIEVREMSLDEVERRFPGKSVMVEGAMSGDSVDEKPTYTSTESNIAKANPGNSLANYSGGAFGSAAGSSIGSGAGSQTRWGGPRQPDIPGLLPKVIVYEFWLRENEEWYDETEEEAPHAEPPDILTTKHVRDRWRIVVLAANNILMDEYADDLWKHGGHPYDRFVFDDVGELYGVSLVDHLAHPQVAVNRLLLALQQNAELTGNPIALVASNAGLGRRGFTNKAGQVVDINAAAMQGQGKGLDWLRPPEPAQILMELIKFYLDQMDQITGLAPVQKSMSSGDRRSQDSMSMVQEVAFVRIRNALDNLEQTLKSVGQKLADLIIDNYTEPRYIAIVGQQGTQTSLALRARHFNVPTEKGATPLKYSINITAGAQMPTSRQSRAAQANFAYGVGLIDRQAWFEANQYPNWQTINARIEDKEAKGQFQPPGQRQRRQKSAGPGTIQ